MENNRSNTNRILIIATLALVGIATIMVLSYSEIIFNNTSGADTEEDTSAEESTPANSELEEIETQILGNPADAGLFTGMTSISIKEPNEMISIRFTAKYSGEVESVVINVISQKGPRLLVGLQEDNDGVPNGDWIGGSSFGSIQLEGERFVEISLEKAPFVSEGKFYHVVIQRADSVLGGEIAVLAYIENSFSQPLNEMNPDILWPDAKMNTLHYDGSKWIERNSWPVYVVKYSDGRSEGQPYSLVAPWVIFGSRYVGQTIVPSSDYKVLQFSFVVNLEGEPIDKLYYEIRDSSNNRISKGVLAERGELTSSKKWMEAKLDSPILVKKDELYRFVLLSPDTELKEPYKVYGHEFTYDSSIGYGALRNHLTISYDGGTTWNRWDDADTVFKLIVSEG